MTSSQRGIGEIADRAVTSIVQHWQPLLLVLLIVSLPEALADGFAPGTENQRVLLSLLAAAIASLVSFPALFAILGGKASSASAAFGWGFTRIWSNVRVYFVSSTVFVALMCVAGVVWLPFVLIEERLGHSVAGVALSAVVPVVLLVVLLPPLWLCSSVVYAVVIIDRAGGWTTFGLAWRRLVARTFWRAWLRGAAVILMTFGPTYAIYAVSLIVQRLAHGEHWTMAIADLLMSLFNTLLYVALSFVLAQDMMNDIRGSDLEAAIDAPGLASAVSQ